MYLVPPDGNKRKWDFRFRNHDGRVVRLPGDRDRDVAQRIADRVEMLVKAKQNGDPPPGELQAWITNMPASLAERLIEFGLLERRRVERDIDIDQQITQFEKVVAARKSNSPVHAKVQANPLKVTL